MITYGGIHHMGNVFLEKVLDISILAAFKAGLNIKLKKICALQ